MRRKDRECTDIRAIYEILDSADVLFVAMMDEDWPYCLPFNFARQDKRIYIHSALEGKKLDCLAKNDKVGFCTATDMKIDVEKATTYFKSVSGTGHAIVVQDEAEKGVALGLLAQRYHARCKVPAPARDIGRVAIIRIDINTITAKINLPK